MTDVNGCTDVVAQSLISFIGSSEITNTLDCFGDNTGAIALSLEGSLNDYQYQWSEAGLPATSSAANLLAGDYSVTVTNDNCCTEVFTETIESPDEIMITMDAIIPVGCQGNLGSATALVVGGTGAYSYSWNDLMNQTEGTATNLAIGNYEVEITDANGCSNTETLAISQSMPINLQEGSMLEPACAGDQNGSLEVLANGGFGLLQYAWSSTDNQAIAENLGEGNYSVTVSDEVGCSSEINISLDEPDALIANASLDQAILCHGDANGTAMVAVVGGTSPYTYAWDDPMTQTTITASQLATGEYTVVATDANGCEVSDDIFIAEPEALTIAAEILPGACSETPNAAINTTAAGGNGNYQFAWSNGMNGQNIEALATGSYALTVTDGQGCSSVNAYEVDNLSVDFINLGQADSLVCQGDLVSYDFSDSDFDDFSWSSATAGVLSNDPDFTIFDADTYYLSASNDLGCQVQDTIVINQSAGNLDAFFIAPTDIVKGDTLVAVELTLPIPDEISWSYDSDHITLVSQDGNQFLFLFTEVGEFDLQLNARLGSCSNEISKTIFVYEKQEDIPFVNPIVPSILDLNIFPNPNDGRFQISVDLSMEMDLVIDLYDAQSVLYDRSKFSGAQTYAKDYQLTLAPGVYYAIVQGAGFRRSVTIVVE